MQFDGARVCHVAWESRRMVASLAADSLMPSIMISDGSIQLYSLSCGAILVGLERREQQPKVAR